MIRNGKYHHMISWIGHGLNQNTLFFFFNEATDTSLLLGRHPVGAAEGCGPQVRELGLRGAGNHVVRPLLAQPGGRRKASPLGSRPWPLHPFAERSEPRGFPKQPSVRCKSKGQNPELWPAGPALLLALWRPAGPWPPAGMGKGRVHELHPRNLVGCMGFKTRWPPRQQTREEGTLLPFHGSICGCPAEGAFPWGPCAVQVWCFGTE